MKTEKDNVIPVCSALQAVTVAAGVLGTLFAVSVGMFGWVFLYAALESSATRAVFAGVAGFATLLSVSALCIVALVTFFGLCGRLKTGTAFTEQNGRAMGRIARCFAACAVVIAAGLVLIRLLLGGTILPMIYVAMLAFLFAFIALMAHALALLIRRAQALQQESDLTV